MERLDGRPSSHCTHRSHQTKRFLLTQQQTLSSLTPAGQKRAFIPTQTKAASCQTVTSALGFRKVRRHRAARKPPGHCLPRR